GVALEDGPGAMAGHLHGRRLRDAGPHQVAHRRPPEVVEDLRGYLLRLLRLVLLRLTDRHHPEEPRLHASRRPRLLEVADRGAVVTAEHPRHDPPGLLLDTLHPLALRLEHRAELGDQGELPAFVILGLARVEADPAGREVDVCPLAR